MIPRLSSRSTRKDGRGQSFQGLSSYLFNGELGKANPARVAWAETVNCHCTEAADAWAEMAWTYQNADDLKVAAGVRRGGQKNEFPVWHVSLNWRDDERPDRAVMMAAAQDLLRRFGLEEHQALVVCHEDTGHRHVHLMVNTVNPHSGRTVDVSKSTKLRLSAWARDYEREQGQVLCPQREENWKRRGDNKTMRQLWRDIAAKQPGIGDPNQPRTYGRNDSRPLWELKKAARAIGMSPDGVTRFGDMHRQAWNSLFAGKRAEQAPACRPEDPAEILKRIMRAQSTFTREDLAKAVSVVTPNAEAFTKVFHQVMALPEVKDLGVPGSRARYSTETMIRIEAEMANAADGLAAARTHAVPERVYAGVMAASAIPGTSRPEFREAAGHGFKAAQLNEEQRVALAHVTRPAALACVVGYAGTGKSTMLGAARELWEAAGYKVRGAALSGIAAQGLESGSGIASTTLHALQGQIDRGRITARDVIVVDEAGMVSSRQMHGILTAAQKAGAKVVLVGDPSQLQAIEAGAAFRAVMERAGSATLTEVRRQRLAWQQQATRDLAEGQVEKALIAYQSESRAIKKHAGKDEAMEALVAEWGAELRSGAPGLILAATRKDVAGLNDKARDAMRAAGALGSKEFKIQAREERIDKPAREFVLPIAEGERLMFTKNDKGLVVKNGTLGTFERQAGNRLVIRLDGPDQRRVEVDLSTYRHLAHGYALTIHKAQGVTVDRAHVLASRSMDRHSTYVALSRHRERVTLHYSRKDAGSLEALAKRIGRDRPKDTTLDYTKSPRQLWQEREARAERAQLHGDLARVVSSATKGSAVREFRHAHLFAKTKPSRDFGRER